MPVRCNEIIEPIAATCAKVHSCIGCESMATCVNLTDSGFIPRLSCHNAGTFTKFKINAKSFLICRLFFKVRKNLFYSTKYVHL